PTRIDQSLGSRVGSSSPKRLRQWHSASPGNLGGSRGRLESFSNSKILRLNTPRFTKKSYCSRVLHLLPWKLTTSQFFPTHLLKVWECRRYPLDFRNGWISTARNRMARSRALSAVGSVILCLVRD